MRAMLTKTPGYIATTNSSQYKTIQTDDINLRESNLLDPKFLLQNKKFIGNNEGSGPLRNLKPS